MIAKTNGSIVLNGHIPARMPIAQMLDEFPVLHPHRFQELVRIRPYQKSDRKAIYGLCCDTGFLGQPADALFQDRELFAELFTKPYLDHEPEWGMVAEVNGKIIGYLLGSICRHFDLIQMHSGFLTAAKIVLRLVTGRYAHHARSRKFIRWLFTAGLFEQPKHPRNAAHLHLDLDKEYRGRDVGRRLWEVYEQRLRAAGVQQCYGSFFSHPKRRPETVYARFGFKVFDRCRTSLFEPEILEPVEVVCMCKNIELVKPSQVTHPALADSLECPASNT